VLLLKVASYGGMLSFELQYTLLSNDAQSYFDADVELIVSIASRMFSSFYSVNIGDEITMAMNVVVTLHYITFELFRVA